MNLKYFYSMRLDVTKQLFFFSNSNSCIEAHFELQFLIKALYVEVPKIIARSATSDGATLKKITSKLLDAPSDMLVTLIIWLSELGQPRPI